MERLIEGFDYFRRVTYPQKRGLFQSLAKAQAPHTMFITCADSRVVPEYFTSAEPGELFVCRNVGNIVPPYAQFTGGVSAAIEYAVAVLGVRNIVICGHSDCGAMKAVMRPASTGRLHAVAAWLRHASVAHHVVEENYRCDCEADHLAALTEENVVAQLDHLRTHPAVAAKLAAGHVGIHGWIYDIETCGIRAYSTQLGRFVPLEDLRNVDVQRLPHATPPARFGVVAEKVFGVAP